MAHCLPLLCCQTSLLRGGWQGACICQSLLFNWVPSIVLPFILLPSPSLSPTRLATPTLGYRSLHSFIQICLAYLMCLCFFKFGINWQGGIDFQACLFLLTHHYFPKLWLGNRALGYLPHPAPSQKVWCPGLDIPVQSTISWKITVVFFWFQSLVGKRRISIS